MPFDETALRAGLRALTAAPPPAPPDRATRSARRWRTIRLRRAGVAAVTAFAVAVPVFAFVSRGTPPTEVRVTGTPMMRWPDRRVPAYRDEAEAARAAFDKSADITSLPVRWLYAGPVSGTDKIAAVWAYCDATTCERVTIAYGTRGQDPRTWPTASTPRAQRPEEMTVPVGWYFRGSREGTV